MLPVQQFRDFIQNAQLFNNSDRLLLAVSGGKDSVLMLHLFKAIGVDFGVAHCNFNLRGEEALRDENFVRLLCASFGIPFYVTHFETKKYAHAHKISTQMAARELRYHWFEELRMQEGYDYIALAQHQNDAAETVLINLTRGTGIGGLHGILPKRGKLIRPLLFLNRDEINLAIEENELAFVEDSSNLSSDYVRNKIRLKVIPQLQEINPNLAQTFAENISRFAEIETFLREQVELLKTRLCVKKADGIYISIDEVEKLASKKMLMIELLKTFDFEADVVISLLEGLGKQSGKLFFSKSHKAIIDREYVIITVRNLHVQDHELVHPSTDVVRFGTYSISISLTEQTMLDTTATKAHVDFQQLIYPLIVRSWAQGDKFKPMGMNNFKKVSDFFIDQKIPVHLKKLIPILVNGNGEVIWIAGMRQDNRYKINEATKKVVIFELKIN
ncbi:tRNA lysidine(34) synthetase TilS [Pedobacter sp. AW1-32]|uniref:tRNA lysidine(34) synthetase TilS n=1 Tax=Pedobacter sp. AW1-32 TaxID=3383026 RepID=UPI003FED9FFE